MGGRLKLAAQALSVLLVLSLLGLLVWKVAEESSSDVGARLAAGERVPAPEFELPTLDGSDTLSLSSLRGKPVVLNFWASWCEPCKEEAPALQEVWQENRERGLVVVGVNFDDFQADARRFVEDAGVTFPLVRDRSGELIGRYGSYGVPVTYVIDRQGRIVGGALLGAVDRGELGRRFRAYLREVLAS